MINQAYAEYQSGGRNINELLTLTDRYVSKLITSMEGRRDDDLKQDVMLRVFTGMGTCKSSYSGWIYGIVLNRLQRARKERKMGTKFESLSDLEVGII